MIFKPIDEISLEHLTSTEFFVSVLNIEYYGRVINDAGQIETSPDCLILDKRHQPYSLKRCEFKYIPPNATAFAHNGDFDLAIIWDLPQPLTKPQLLNDLRDQNGCQEIIVLNKIRHFNRLPDYNILEDVNYALVQNLREFLLANSFHVTYAAYLIAKAYPKNINKTRLIEHLTNQFIEIRNMRPQGRGNIIGRFRMTRPNYINKMFGNYYKWNNQYEPNSSINLMIELARVNFESDLPDERLIEDII